MVSVDRLWSDRKLSLVWRFYLLRLATSVPLIDTTCWAWESTTGDSSLKKTLVI